MTAVPTSPTLVPMSVLPGRVRWEVRGLLDDPAFAARLAEAVGAHPLVRSAAASPASGRLLVHFDPATPVGRVAEAVGSIAERLGPPAAAGPLPGARGQSRAGGRPAESGPPTAMRRILALASGGGLAGAAESDPDLRFLLDLLRPHRRPLRLALCGSAAANVVGLLRIVPIGFAMNALADGRAPPVLGTRMSSSASVVALTAATVLGTILRGWLRQRSQVLWTGAARDIQHDLRMLVWEKVQRLDTAVLEDQWGAAAGRILGEEINQFERGLDAAYSLIDIGFNTVILFGALFAFSRSIGSMTALPVPLLILLAVTLHPRVRADFAEAGEANSRLTTTVADSVGGIITARSFTHEEEESSRIEEASDAYRRASQRSATSAAILPMWLETTILVGQVGIYLLNARRVANGATVGEMSVINSLAGHLLYPLTSLGPLLENLQRGMSAFDRVRRFLAETSIEVDEGRALDRSEVRGEISYRSVRFAYPSGPPLFDALSLTFLAQSWNGVVGLTGSGKSSLIKLLLRLYEPQTGEIELDGRAIRDLRRSDLRRSIALVSQDIYLFRRSIFDNLAIGCPGASRASVIKAAKAARAHAFIMGFPNQYDTVVGEGGQGLSGGERQRIAIARALLKDAPIIVFDEATSSLDSNTEVEVQKELHRLFHGRTVIVIAHRLSAVRNADRIVVLDRGKVVQEGTHRALVRRAGPYRSLWHSQLGLAAGEETLAAKRTEDEM
ncbi:MAG TPA: ABC transporter ATP-binding protein [Allosphingosinicella sp.]